MRILYVLSQKLGKTGSGVFLQELYKSGQKKGHTQAIVHAISDIHEYIEFDKTFTKKDSFALPFQTQELPFDIFGMSDVMPYASRTFSSMKQKELGQYEKSFKAHLENAINTFDPDIVITNHLWLVTSYVLELFDGNVVCLCHGTDLRQRKLAPHIFEMIRSSFGKLHKVFALNDEQKEIMLDEYSLHHSQIVVSGSGYDSTYYTPNPKPPTPPVRFLYIGKISYAKGLLSLIRALGQLKADTNLLCFDLLGGGEGEEAEHIKKEAQKLPFEINFLGFVSHQELKNYLENSHILILPSFFEGLPLVVLEALASGLQVIVTKLPGLSEFLGDEIQALQAIKYIKLPQMLQIDTPKPHSAQEFESSLAQAIDDSITQYLENKQANWEDVMPYIKTKSWDSLFETILVHSK